jgi:hypothetical protein
VCGRFESRDTYPTKNGYAYCANNPIGHSDPTGHLSLVEDGVAVAEGMGLEGSAAEGAGGFFKWFVQYLIQSTGRESIKILVEFVEDGTIEEGLGNARMFGKLSELTIQVERTGDAVEDTKALCHELGEAFRWLTNANGSHFDFEAEFFEMFRDATGMAVPG